MQATFRVGSAGRRTAGFRSRRPKASYSVDPAKADEIAELQLLRACSIEQAIARVTAFLEKPSGPQALIFVDGDHAANKIAELEMLTPLSSVHVVVVMARGKTEPSALGAHSPWTTLVSTKTKGKNAADQAICWMTARLSGGPLVERRRTCSWPWSAATPSPRSFWPCCDSTGNGRIT